MICVERERYMATIYQNKKDGKIISFKFKAFLFHSEKSVLQPHEPTYITKHLKKFMKQIGLPDISPHDLRYTCATVLLQNGADIKSVQDILGHTEASITLNFYVNSDIESMRNSVEKAFEL